MQVLGIDAGGTKTKFTLYSEQGNWLESCELESCHILQTSDQKMIEVFDEGIRRLHYDSEKMVIIAGIAGYGDNPSLKERIQNNCQISFTGVHAIYNDAYLALAGALNGEDGILVIAGTGSIALSKKGTDFRRRGGWGMHLGDEGSGYWLAKKLLEAFTKQADGRMEKTLLYELVRKHCRLIHDYEIILYIHNILLLKRDKIASLTLILYEAACLQDLTALQIFQNCANELTLMIRNLQKDFDESVQVSYLGGVFQAKEFILPYLQDNLPHTIIHPPCHPAEKGAWILYQQRQK